MPCKRLRKADPSLRSHGRPGAGTPGERLKLKAMYPKRYPGLNQRQITIVSVGDLVLRLL
jgi:hypothetical protein